MGEKHNPVIVSTKNSQSRNDSLNRHQNMHCVLSSIYRLPQNRPLGNLNNHSPLISLPATVRNLAPPPSLHCPYIHCYRNYYNVWSAGLNTNIICNWWISFSFSFAVIDAEKKAWKAHVFVDSIVNSTIWYSFSCFSPV